DRANIEMLHLGHRDRLQDFCLRVFHRINRRQKSDIRGQRPEIRCQMSDVTLMRVRLTSDF
ncbi:MAG TPA: hypothetical protein VGW32_07685, partial [Pyrinomonadaceae bacterium]|nr:hypothetical protein [Pyrinomonadaceae bacterium]